MVGLLRRYWIILAVGVIVPLVYAFFRIPDQNFLDGFIGDWLATIIGLIIGIPIALELERWQTRSEANQRRIKILRNLKEELSYNLELISKSWPRKSAIHRGAYLAGAFRVESWRALSDGGELQWINDLEILESISTSYYYIRQLSQLADRLWSSTIITSRTLSNQITTEINKRADTFGGMAEQHIETTLQQIEPYINKSAA